MKKIIVLSVDSTPKQDGKYLTQSVFWIDPFNRICGLKQRYSTEAISSEEHNKKILVYNLEEEDNYRVGNEELRIFLMSQYAQTLLTRICLVWKKEFKKGRMEHRFNNQYVSLAIEELISCIKKLPHSEYIYEIQPISAEEWIDSSELPVTALTKDSELEELANYYEAEASKKAIPISDSFFELLMSWHNNEVRNWISKARDAMPNGWREDVIIVPYPWDDEYLEVHFYFFDDTEGSVLVSESGVMVLFSPFDGMDFS